MGTPRLRLADQAGVGLLAVTRDGLVAVRDQSERDTPQVLFNPEQHSASARDSLGFE